jgi:phosphatidate cytidylyltransferase
VTSKRISFGADFSRRVLTALIGATLLLGLIMLGSPLWNVLVIGTALLCVWELHHMISPNSRTGLVGMLSITLANFYCLRVNNYNLLALVLLIIFIFQVTRSFTMESAGANFLLRYFVYTTLGALYISIPMSLLLGVHSLEQGAAWTMIAFLSNWATDGLALIGGRLVGRTKLAPQISPGKTVEGAFIGLLGGFLIGMIAALILNVPLKTALLVNIAVPILTILGDLLESWIKRYFAVKDSSSLLPGHGGFLDRADGMMLAGPAVYLILMFVR